ncbi:hypothetical protein ES703_81783 [subsurface metagenome]
MCSLFILLHGSCFIPSCIQTATIYKRHCEYFVAQHKLSEAIYRQDCNLVLAVTARRRQRAFKRILKIC